MPSRTAAIVARPTVRVDGQEYATVRELLTGMDMVESEGGMSRLQLRLTNFKSRARGRATYAFEDNQVLKLGAAISVHAGPESAPQEVFRGWITGVEGQYSEGPPELVVHAEDAFQRARLVRRTKAHANLTIRQLATDVAGVCSLTPVIDGFTDQIGPHIQMNESDLAFLRRLLVRYGGDLQVVGSEMHVAPRSGVHRGTVDLEMHEGLRRVRAIADLTDQVNDVTVTGWDAAQGRRITVTQTTTATGPGSGSTGATVLQNSPFGRRSHHVSHVAVRDDTEARAVATTITERRARRFVTLEATSGGNPLIRVGTHVHLTGLGDRFDNTYYVVEARHRYAVPSPGYVTDFRAECAHWGV
jgi:phage protein D